MEGFLHLCHLPWRSGCVRSAVQKEHWRSARIHVGARVGPAHGTRTTILLTAQVSSHHCRVSNRQIVDSVPSDRTLHAVRNCRIVRLRICHLRMGEPSCRRLRLKFSDAARRCSEYRQLRARRSAPDKYSLRIDPILVRMDPKKANRCLHILKCSGKWGFAAQPIVDRGNHIAACRERCQDRRPISVGTGYAGVAATPAATMDPDDQWPFRPRLLAPVKIEFDRTIADEVCKLNSVKSYNTPGKRRRSACKDIVAGGLRENFRCIGLRAARR